MGRAVNERGPHGLINGKAPQPRYVSDGVRGPASTTLSQNVENRYLLEFRSRYALSYGHSFVNFGRLDKNGRMVNLEVAGLAPATSSTTPYVVGHFLPVPAETGESDGDLDDALPIGELACIVERRRISKDCC